MRRALLSILVLASSSRLTAQTIVGTVIEEGSRQPVAAASILLVDSAGMQRAVLSTKDGQFAITANHAGRYRLRAERIGYGFVETAAIDLAQDETVTVQLQVPISALAVAPLIVQERRQVVPPMLQDFYARRERGTTGAVFFTRGDIQQRNPMLLTDLLAGVPGLQVRGNAGSAGARSVRVPRNNALRDCAPRVFVDGRQYRQFDAQGLDTFTPADLDGVEVYGGLAEIPAEFGGDGARCGVIALWTHRGSPVNTDVIKQQRGTELRFLGALTATVLMALWRF